MLQAAHRHCAPSAPSVSISTWIQAEKVTEPAMALAGAGKASGGAEGGAQGIIVQSPLVFGGFKWMKSIRNSACAPRIRVWEGVNTQTCRFHSAEP